MFFHLGSVFICVSSPAPHTPPPHGTILHLFNWMCSLPRRPVNEESEPPEVEAPGRWHGVYVNRTSPTPSESATTVKSLIKSFDLGRPGISSFHLMSKSHIQTVAPRIKPVSTPHWPRMDATTRAVSGSFHVEPVCPRDLPTANCTDSVAQFLSFLGNEASGWHSSFS